MALDVHTLEVVAPYLGTLLDRVQLFQLIGVAVPAGSGAGSPVTAPIVFASPFASTNYSVEVTPTMPANFQAFVSWSNKTQVGADVTLTPPATQTLPACTFDFVAIGG
jgi:hypothetical protein